MKLIFSLLVVCFTLTNCAQLDSNAPYDYKENIFSNYDDAKSLDLKLDKLNFSNTYKWFKNYEKKANTSRVKKLFADFSKSHHMPPPPLNSSERTQRELEYLKELQKLRSKEIQQRIKREKVGSKRKFEDHERIELFALGHFTNDFPYLKKIYFEELTIIFMSYKRKYDRVRPNFLDKKITPSIFVPMHASYPSGHSSQAYFLASLLAYIDPGNKDVFFNSAFEIAKNREYAGVHYPSDSDAGRNLGKAVFQYYLKKEKFKMELSRYRDFYQHKLREQLQGFNSLESKPQT